MTLYYIAVIGSGGSLGIIKKIEGKIGALNELGQNAKGLLLVHKEDWLPENIDNITFLSYPKSDQTIAFNLIDNYFEQYLEPEDRILFRYPMASKPLLKLVSKFPDRIWFEHNTIEEDELRSNFKKLNIRDWLYIFRHLYFTDVWGNYRFLKDEQKYATRVFGLAKGGICVTDEISTYESGRTLSKYHCYTVSNGIDVVTISLKPVLNFDGKNLHFVMMSTTANDWHGIDRFIIGMEKYKGPENIILHLVGNFTSKVRELVNQFNLQDRVIFYPKTYGNALNDILYKSHIGIGSLGMHRIPLKQGSVLKVKEYMAMGMPFIIAHDEVDLVGKEDIRHFYLQFPADNSPIDMKQVLAFAQRVFADGQHRKRIHDLALKYVDMKVKMQQLIDIINMH